MDETPTPQSDIEIMAALLSAGIEAELAPGPVAWMDGIPIFVLTLDGVEALRFLTWSDVDAGDVPAERALVINNRRLAEGTLARAYVLEPDDAPGTTRLMFDYVWSYGPGPFTPANLVYALRLFQSALVGDFGLAAQGASASAGPAGHIEQEGAQ